MSLFSAFVNQNRITKNILMHCFCAFLWCNFMHSCQLVANTETHGI